MSATIRDLLHRYDNPAVELRGAGACGPSLVELARHAAEMGHALERATLERCLTELGDADALSLSRAFARERIATRRYMAACEALNAVALEGGHDGTH